jgi:ribosomal protein L15E
MQTIEQTKTEYTKNPNTKTSYTLVSKEVEMLTEKQHHLTTCDDTVKWFRRFGGSETVTRGYTCAGYKVVKLISTSPDKQTKIVREFRFKDVN